MEEGHPDEVVLGNASNSSLPAPQVKTTGPAPVVPVNKPPQTPNNVRRNVGHVPAPAMVGRPSSPGPHPPQHAAPAPYCRPNSPALTTPNTSTNRPPGAVPPESIGFYSARAINKDVLETGLAGDGLVPKPQQAFNPKAESPSIRRTPGIDHSSSKKLKRDDVQLQSSQSGPVTGLGLGSRRPPGFQAGRGNVVNPHLDQARRIGAPGAGGSPLANRGQYRPPTMKRPLPAEGPAIGRPALAEVTNSGPVGVVQGQGDNQAGVDMKRQKTS